MPLYKKPFKRKVSDYIHRTKQRVINLCKRIYQRWFPNKAERKLMSQSTNPLDSFSLSLNQSRTPVTCTGCEALLTTEYETIPDCIPSPIIKLFDMPFCHTCFVDRCERLGVYQKMLYQPLPKLMYIFQSIQKGQWRDLQFREESERKEKEAAERQAQDEIAQAMREQEERDIAEARNRLLQRELAELRKEREAQC